MNPLSRPLLHPLIAPLFCCISCFRLHFSLLLCSRTSTHSHGDLLLAMEALGAARVCIGNWVEKHNCSLGTRRVSGPKLVLQAANISASDESLTFYASTTFAHIPVSQPIFGKVTGSCLSDMIYPNMDDNPNLLGCTLDFVGAGTGALCSVFHKKVSRKVGTRVTNFITPLSTELDGNGKRKVGCQFSSQRVKKDDVGVIHHERVFEVADRSSVSPVFFLPSNGSLGWADAYYAFATRFRFTASSAVCWPMHNADPLIGSSAGRVCVCMCVCVCVCMACV